MQRRVAVLFAREDSIYKTMPDCDVWDIKRNALNWPGGMPIVAHPPCRLWGRLRTFANVITGEKELAPWAVEQVRKFGGVLEHPYKSTLWDAMSLPHPGIIDKFQGWTIAIPQFWFGHKAYKRSWFYIVGVGPYHIPPVPLVMGDAEFVIQTRKRKDHRPRVPKADREHTPLKLAEWLLEVARRSERCEVL